MDDSRSWDVRMVSVLSCQLIDDNERTLILKMFYHRFKLLLHDPVNGSDEDHDSEDVIRNNALERGVLALPGTVFLPNKAKTTYVRASFSILDEEDVNEALSRLRDAILDARK